MRLHLGDVAGARDAYQESLATFQKNSEKMKAAYPMVGLGDVLFATGDLEGAKASYANGLAASNEAGEKHESAMALTGLGNVLLEQSDTSEARKKFEAALSLRKDLGEKDSAADSTMDLARVDLEENQPAAAESKLRPLLPDLQSGTVRDQEAVCRVLLARALADQQKTKAAHTEAVKALALASKTQHRGVSIFVTIEASGITRTNSSLVRALAEARKIGFLRDALQGELVLSELEMNSGTNSKARARLKPLQDEARAKGFIRIANRAAHLASS
jgi:tetratricopeptide (TPR) repeat protein